jgi:hypothetical protein
MKGTYRFYENGKLIAEQSNLITTEGKRSILRYLAGHVPSMARSLAVGTGTTSANVADTKLTFEVARTDIAVTSPDFTTQKIVFKGTLPQDQQFAIWEIGAYSGAASDQMGQSLFVFDSASEPWTNGSFQPDANRIGADALRVNAALSTTTTSSLNDIFLETERYLESDKFVLAYAPVDANLASIKIRFRTDATNYFEYSVVNLATGYRVETWAKSQMTKTGAPSWENIIGADIIVTAKAAGATNVDFDGMRIEPDSSFVDNVLISRTVLGAPVVKTNSSEMDIEYTLDVTI